MRLTSETVCAALLVNGSVKNTAKALGTSESTIYNYMQEKDFKELYRNAIADVYTEAVNIYNAKVCEAVECIADIMTDKEVNAQTRLLAAQTIIKTSVQVFEIGERMREKANDAKYDIF